LAGVESPSLATTSEVVERALADAQTMIETTGATSGVDRIHTVLHGYLRAICDEAGIAYGEGTTINGLCNLIRAKHATFEANGARADDITKIFRAISQIMDVLDPIRNKA